MQQVVFDHRAASRPASSADQPARRARAPDSRESLKDRESVERVVLRYSKKRNDGRQPWRSADLVYEEVVGRVRLMLGRRIAGTAGAGNPTRTRAGGKAADINLARRVDPVRDRE